MGEWTPLPPLLSVADLASRYQVSERQIRERSRKGRLPRPVDPTATSLQWHPEVIRRFEFGELEAWSPDAPGSLRSVS